jgi:nitrogen regulatory protein PII
MKFDIVIAIVPFEKECDAIDAIKKAGATGATVISAHGTGIKEAKTFFRLTVELKQSIILSIVERHMSQKIIKATYDALDMDLPGRGIVFSFQIDAVMGLESQLSVMRQEAVKEF